MVTKTRSRKSSKQLRSKSRNRRRQQRGKGFFDGWFGKKTETEQNTGKAESRFGETIAECKTNGLPDKMCKSHFDTRGDDMVTGRAENSYEECMRVETNSRDYCKEKHGEQSELDFAAKCESNSDENGACGRLRSAMTEQNLTNGGLMDEAPETSTEGGRRRRRSTTRRRRRNRKLNKKSKRRRRRR